MLAKKRDRLRTDERRRTGEEGEERRGKEQAEEDCGGGMEARSSGEKGMRAGKTKRGRGWEEGAQEPRSGEEERRRRMKIQPKSGSYVTMSHRRPRYVRRSFPKIAPVAHF